MFRRKTAGYPAAAAKYRQREEDLAQDWRRLDDRIEAVTDEIDALSKNTEPCWHLMTIPGIGPIISSAVVAAIMAIAMVPEGSGRCINRS